MTEKNSYGATFLRDYAQRVADNILRTDFQTLSAIADRILATKQTGNRIYLAGNGGSASTASHMANDLLKGARVLGREGFRSICLADSTPIVTCLANDFSYEEIYSIGLKTYAQPGDIYIVFSGSGNSPNIVHSVKTAKEMGLTVIGFGGRDGGKMKEFCDFLIIAPTDSMEELEDMHLLYEHALVSLLKEQLADIFDIETIKPLEQGRKFKAVLFDFDGTLSLIREGWQDVMVPYFCEVLEAAGAPRCEVESTVAEFVGMLTGKQTIYQCIRLAQEVENRGGKALEPLEYKHEFHRRLLEKIQYRLDLLRSGKANVDDYLVPGARELLQRLADAGLDLYLASGTDENYVLEEAALLKLDRFFPNRIYGAKDDYKTFSKEKVIRSLIEKNEINGRDLLGFGDGYVEILNLSEVGGYAVGVATNEKQRKGIDTWKRDRLINAGASLIIPDFGNAKRLTDLLGIK